MNDMNTSMDMTSDERVQTQLMEKSLEGVMFHNYNTDLFDLLNLDGFKKLHMNQAQEENAEFKDMKHKFIKTFHKMPSLSVNTGEFWKASKEGMAEDDTPNIVREALASYYDWETGVLECLFAWRKEVKDKTLFQEKIRDVMTEIEHLETIMNILDEHEYNYECIREMSDYLLHH